MKSLSDHAGKKVVSLFLCLCLVCVMLPGCSKQPTISGTVAEVEKNGHARLDITIEDFEAAGFALGDVVTVKAGRYRGDMPYLNGYYVDSGEYMLRAYPGQSNIHVCINYGKFAESAGIAEGDRVKITLSEKAGALTLQEISNLVYTNDIEDYGNNETTFANFRPVELGRIAPGRLYRSASPIMNTYGRAATADRLIQGVQVKTVMNLTNTYEEISEAIAADDYASPYYASLYSGGHVIALGMPIDYRSDGFADGIVRGFTFLAEGEPPFLVHCIEGKDRAGFAAMMLEALMGAPLDDIVEDYMQSYVNYYHLDPKDDTEKYQMIADKNVMEMLRTVAGLEKGAALDEVDLSAAAETWLTAHGMSPEAINTIKGKLQ